MGASFVRGRGLVLFALSVALAVVFVGCAGTDPSDLFGPGPDAADRTDSGGDGTTAASDADSADTAPTIDAGLPFQDAESLDGDSPANDAAPSACTYTVGAEYPIASGSPDAGLTGATGPRLVVGSNLGLVLWSDNRNSLDAPGYQLSAARISPTATVLDPAGIDIRSFDNEATTSYSGGSSSQTSIGSWNAAFDGTNFLVVWAEYSYRQGTSAARILGKRVSATGQLLDGTPLDLVDNVNVTSATIAMGFDGTNYVVAWVEGEQFSSPDDPGSVRAARISASGALVDGSLITLSPVGTAGADPVVSCGTTCLVAWEQMSPSVGFRTMTFSGGNAAPVGGTFIDAQTFPPAGAVWAPAIGFDGSHYLVAWASNTKLVGMYLDGAGALLVGPTSIADIPLEGAGYFFEVPSVVWDGASFRVAWWGTPGVDGKTLYAATMNYGGSVGAPATLTDDYVFSAPTAGCFDNACVMVVRHEPFSDPRDCLFVSSWSSNLQLSAPNEAPLSGATQRLAGIASDGTRALVSWTEEVPSLSNNTVYPSAFASFVEASGQAGPRLDAHVSGSAAFGAGAFLVAGTQNTPAGNPFGFVRIDSVGTVSSFTPLAPSAYWHTVAFGDDEFLIAWIDSDGIKGVRVDSSGTVRDATPLNIDISGGNKSGLSAAFDGSNFLLVWADNRVGPEDVYGRRVSPSGVVLEQLAISISAAPSYQITPSVASSSAGGFVVIWGDLRNDPSGDDVYGARVDADGSVLDPQGIPISLAPGRQVAPTITWDARVKTFSSVWEDSRPNEPSRVSGAQVALPASTPTTFVVADGTSAHGQPLIAGSAGGAIVPYLFFDPSLEAIRAATRRLSCN